MLGDLPRLTSGPSIYEHVLAHRDTSGRLDDAGLELPDHSRVGTASRWAPGGLDGTFSHHAHPGQDPKGQAAEVAALVAKAAGKPSKKNLRRLYDAVLGDGHVLDFVDPMVEELVALEPYVEAVHDVARWLAATGADRGPVKVGIALLGVTGGFAGGLADDDLELLRVLGAHDELTLYVAVALSRSLDDPEPELWAVARSVVGWGRIHCVERLAQTEDEAIKAWILRQGFRNSIADAYLVHVAATTGGLLDALRRDDVDRELLTVAGDILATLVGSLTSGGPAEDIDDYEDGVEAVEAYLTHMGRRAEMLSDFVAVAVIRDFLGAEEVDWDMRIDRGWTATRREAFEARCDEILAQAEWADRIAVALMSDDRVEFAQAQDAARRQGIDTYDVHVDKIRHEPFGLWWFEAWRQADGPRAERLAALARVLLPLDRIVGELADEDGFGTGWEPHRALDWTLQALAEHPGVGGDLVLVGLQCPVTRNRNMALRALAKWPRRAWPDGAVERVEHLTTADPNERTRQNATDALGGLTDSWIY